jgi:hypothetical protein
VVDQWTAQDVEQALHPYGGPVLCKTIAAYHALVNGQPQPEESVRAGHG